MKIQYSLDKISYSYLDKFELFVNRLDVFKGEVLGVAGLNGSGKSTLLRVLAFLEAPCAGDLCFNSEVVSKNGMAALRKGVTMLPQSPYLLKRTVEDNLKYGLKLRKRKNIRDSLCFGMDAVGLPMSYLKKSWRELSGGEAKRVALASRLVLEPDVLLLDEPTAEIDKDSSLKIADVIKNLYEKNITVIVSSHDSEWLKGVSGRIIRMERGAVLDENYEAPFGEDGEGVCAQLGHKGAKVVYLS